MSRRSRLVPETCCGQPDQSNGWPGAAAKRPRSSHPASILRPSGQAIDRRLGVDVQKAAYEQFKKLPGSYADNTMAKLGQAVKLP